MSDRKTYYSVGRLAELVEITPRAVQLRIKQRAIEPDADVVLPGGRTLALFEDRTLAVLMDTTPETNL